MPRIYEHIFDKFRIVEADDAAAADCFSKLAQWLDSPGCLFQRNNVVLSSRIRTEGIIKPGLFISVVLKGAGGGRQRNGATQTKYSDDTIVVMALKQPTLWEGDAPRGAGCWRGFSLVITGASRTGK